MSTLIFDHKHVKGDQLQKALVNRGLFLGESPFSTILFHRGFYFLDDHLQRLKSTFELLYPGNNWEKYEKSILKDLESVQVDSDEKIYVRVTLFQDFEEEVHSLIYSKKITHDVESPLKLKVAKMRRSPGSLPSYVKYGGYLESNIEKRKAKVLGFDDVVYLDNNQHLTEASTSNIFFRVADQIKTPALNGCLLDGITRKNLIKAFKGHDINVQKGSFSLEELLQADEIWLTNSITGLRRVSKVEDRVFKTEDGNFKKYSEMFGAQAKIGKVIL